MQGIRLINTVLYCLPLLSADAPEGKRTACYDIEIEIVSVPVMWHYHVYHVIMEFTLLITVQASCVTPQEQFTGAHIT